ncbi:MAG TPA: alpha/beta hydrolase-fold protein [Ktedonobacteraceae bacterium]|nr:alpha/beta hydrolase-fold protein [Ktedonobacteraceae bacterium]
MQTPTETSFRTFITRLQELADDPGAAASYAGSYLAARAGNFPIVEGNMAHFIYKNQPGMIAGVGGEWNGFDARKAIMEPVGAGLLHYQREFELDARLDYFFFEYETASVPDLHSDPGAIVLDDMHPVLDPLNRRVGESGFGPRSELAMPTYRRPAITREQPGVPAGMLREESIKSEALQQERAYTVYLPPAYNPDDRPYPSIYFHDGGDYLSMGKAPIVLNNLISMGAILPVVAVFIPPVDRIREYNCDDRYVSFLCDELLPKLQGRYNLSSDPAQRAIIGPSLGGLISLYIGKQRPDRFGLVGAQSSAVKSINGLDIFDARAAYSINPRLPLRLHLVIGSYEDCFSTNERGRCSDLLNPVRELRSLLEQRGYPYRYAEHHQGHSWGLWRDTLAGVLTYFFGESR